MQATVENRPQIWPYTAALSHFRGEVMGSDEPTTDPFLPHHRQMERALLGMILGKVHNRPDWTEAGKTSFLWAKQISPTLFCSAEEERESPLLKQLWEWFSELELEAPKGEELLPFIAKDGWCATTYGNGTGLGTFEKNGVSFLAFGPQVSPLGDCSGFGIINDGLHPAKIEGPSISGVARLHRDPYLAKWIEIYQKLEGEVLHLEIKPLEPVEGNFVFYVKSDEAKVGGKILRPGSLETYRGVNVPVELSGVSLEIVCEKMEVIPLPGGDDFWGATFLIACPLEKISARIR